MADIYKEAAEARVGADRMAMGLSCIPDALYGDMTVVADLRARLEQAKRERQKWFDAADRGYTAAEAAEAQYAAAEPVVKAAQALYDNGCIRGSQPHLDLETALANLRKAQGGEG